MKPQINLSVDKNKVTEGDIVEVTWSCSPADRIQFTLDNGFKANSIDVESSGSKKFRLNRSKGRTHLVIAVQYGGKTYYRSVTVRVRKMKATKAEKVYDYTGAKGVRANGLKNSWLNFKSKMKMAWSYMPENKRLAYKVLTALCVVALLSLISPKILSIGLLVVSGYLCYVIFKK